MASPISRRQTLRLVWGAAGGALLASLSLGGAARGFGSPYPGPAQASPVTCPPGKTVCGSNCCNGNQTCCNGQICCSVNTSCCGTKCCGRGEMCCGGTMCCTKGPSPSNPCVGGHCR